MHMALASKRPSPSWSLDRLRRYFGMIPAERILLDPPPGTATERDVLLINERKERLCELVDGVLVEKAMGTKEGLLGAWLVHLLWGYLERHPIGIALGGDGMLRLFPGLVRVPDVSFISKKRLSRGKLPDEAIASLGPDLAVEVVSEGNTKKEIERKLGEYFASGTRLAWVIHPKTETVDVYTSPSQKKTLRQGQTLTGGDVLPGFRVTLRRLFTPGARR
jgi:Uma2 family endonuclease